MEIDGGSVMFAIPIAAGKAFYLLDLAIEAFPQRIGFPMLGVGDDVIDMGFEAPGGLDDRIESGVSGPEIPTGEIPPHPTFSVIVP